MDELDDDEVSAGVLEATLLPRGVTVKFSFLFFPCFFGFVSP